jgi:site-specific DNA recombinase
MNTPQYFLYARKSTEDEERQVMSIEAQITELTEYAKREHLNIAQSFIESKSAESKSAKSPGREVFGQLVKAINDSPAPVGILAWHPDRLARNSIDGGQIIYLIDTGKLLSLRFPTFWFEPTPQGLFMLQVAFGQSKYYSDNLAENVKRGIRQKLRRGEWTTLAPLGYTNNPKRRNIEADTTKSRIINKAFEEFAEGKHTLKSLGERMDLWGLTGKTGKPICKASLQRMLTNPVYLGIIKHNGESYQGSFPAIVSLATFEKVQTVLKDKAKPRHSRKRHYFPFLGLLKCGECGAAITAQYAHGHGGTYKYYRCTKRLGHCSQKYVSENNLASQLKDQISKVAIPEDWKEKMLAQIEIWKKENIQSSEELSQNLNDQLKNTEQKLDNLINAFLDGSIEKDIYLSKKDELIKTKLFLHQKQQELGRKGNIWNEPLREWVISSFNAQKLAQTGQLDEIKLFIQKIGTNRLLHNKTVSLQYQSEWQITFVFLQNLHSVLQSPPPLQPAVSEKNNECLTWSGCWESNPVYLLPKQTYYRYTTAR